MNPNQADNNSRFFQIDHLRADLRRHSVRGVAFTVGSEAARFVLTLGSQAVLARMLRIEDFGLVAMVLAATGFVSIIKDFGLATAVTQRPDVNHDQVSTLFWINAAVCCGLALLVAGLAPLLVLIFSNPDLLWIGLALALVPLLDGLGVQHQGIMSRQMRFGTLACVEIASIAISIGVAVSAALAGAGYWSLVLLQVTRSFVYVILIWIMCPWRPSRPQRGKGVRPMLAFGGHLTLFSLIDYFCRDLDKLIIGKMFGEYGLGLFSNAQKLMQLPVQQLNAPLGRVAMPALSRLTHDPVRFRAAYTRMVTMLMQVMMPAVVIALFWGESLIRVALGPDWVSATPIFQALAVATLIRPLCNAAGWILLARGDTKRLLKFRVATIWVSPMLFALGAYFYGIQGVALGSAVAAWGLTLPWLIYVERGTGIGLWTMVKPAVAPMIAALVAGACIRWVAPMGHSLFAGLLAMPVLYVLLMCVASGGLGPVKNFEESLAILLKRKPA